MNLGYQLGIAFAKSRTPNSAGFESKQRLHYLITGAVHVLPWVKPHVKTSLDVSKKIIADNCRQGEECQGYAQIGQVARSHVGHDYGNAEKHKSRSQVLLQDKHDYGDAPHGYQRRDKFQRRQIKQTAYLRADVFLRQLGAMICQIRREEQHQQYLAELRRLHTKRTDNQPVATAAYLRAEEYGKGQDDDTGQPQNVLIARQSLQQSYRAQHEYHQYLADDEPF